MNDFRGGSQTGFEMSYITRTTAQTPFYLVNHDAILDSVHEVAFLNLRKETIMRQFSQTLLVLIWKEDIHCIFQTRRGRI